MEFLYSQLFKTPAIPTQSFDGQTVIVTGSNVGLGLEAARHLARLNAKKVILAVRNLEAGEEAKASIEQSVGRKGVVEVWKLDLAEYSSVKAFADRASRELDRIDVLLENAGVIFKDFKMVEEDEAVITINVVSTFLLALLMLPKMQESASKYNINPRLVIVSSEVHAWAKFPERNHANIFGALSDKQIANMDDRYFTSKLLEILVIRQIAPLLAQGKHKDVILNTLNPGLCHSALSRDTDSWVLRVMKFLLARTTEVGGRTLVAGAAAGRESHGRYMTDAAVNDGSLAKWVKTDQGNKLGAQVWRELSAKLEKIQPGVTSNLN